MIKLKNHKYAQCHVETSGKDIYFVSYSTTVIKAMYEDDNMYTISCTGMYSPTTGRHIGWFLQEYFPTLNYYDMKAIAGTEKTISIGRG